MNSLDIILGIFVLFYAIIGFFSGSLRSLLGLGVVFLAVYFSSNFSHTVLNTFGLIGEATKSAYPALFIALFLILYILGEILLSVLKRIIKVVILGPLDGVFGMFISGIRAVVLSGVIFQMILKLPISDSFRALISGSVIIGFAQDILIKVYPYIVSKIPEVEKFFKGRFADTAKDTGTFDRIKMFASFEAFPKLKDISLPRLK
jgi:uncharacterized membrane protein required for colicin V production